MDIIGPCLINYITSGHAIIAPDTDQRAERKLLLQQYIIATKGRLLLIMYDFHTHSAHSYDGFDTIEEICLRAIEIGLDGIALTEHFDPEYLDDDTSIDLDKYWETVSEVSDRYSDRIYIAKGVELGLQPGHVMDECRQVAASRPWDFVLASIHVADGAAIDVDRFLAGRDADDILHSYYKALSVCLDEFDDFDVLAHINIIDRYIDLSGMSRAHMPMVAEILQKAVDAGKGIEINTSSFRKGLGERTTPTQEMVDMYVSMGGEIITVGSDSHGSEHLGYKLDYALDMIRKAGLSHYATFHGRKPVFHRIS